MIILAHGDELEFKLPDERDIIQVQLEPPPLIQPLPLPDQVKPLPADTSVPKPPTSEAVKQEMAIEPPRPVSEVWPVERDLPRIAPQPTPPDAQTLDTPGTPSNLTPLKSTLPSVSPLPRQEVEALDQPNHITAPANLTVAPPRVATSPSTQSQASQTPTSDMPLRRRDEDEARAIAAAAAAASGPPSPPMPRLANPAPGAMAPSGGAAASVPRISEAWRVAPSNQGSRNARALRMSPTGCRFTERLTVSERQVCEERFNTDAARGAETPIHGSGNVARDRRFAREGARQLYRYEEQRRPLSGGVGVVGTADCPGSNFGTGCAGSLLDPSMQMDSSSNVQTRRDGPRTRGPIVPGAAGAARRPVTGD